MSDSSSSHPNKASGLKDQVVGSLKEGAGKMIASDKMKAEGKLQKEGGKAEKEAAKSEEKPKKALEILLKRVVPELDLNLFGFSAKLMNHLKFYFRYFYDNRMNFLLKEKRKFYKKKAISQKQEDLVFKPELGKKTAKFAEEYRKKCKQQIQEEFNHQENNAEQGTKSNSLKLEEIYNVLRLKKENEIARLKLQQNEELMKKCTFQPNSNKETKSPKTVNTVEVSKKLHVDANQRKLKKKNIEEEKKREREDPSRFPFPTNCLPI